MTPWLSEETPDFFGELPIVPTTFTNYGNVAVLTVKDDLSADGVEAFSLRVRQALEGGNRLFVVDCTSVHAFDSAGLEALLELQTKCDEELGAVKLCGLDETCSKILEITRLSRRFEFFDELDSAVKSFA